MNGRRGKKCSKGHTPPPFLSLPLLGVGGGMLPRRLFVKTKGGEEGKLGSKAKTPPPTKSVSRDN